MITHRLEVIDDSSDAMKIGRDIMNELGFILHNFKVVQWDDCFLRLNTVHERKKRDTNEQEDHEFPDGSKEVTSSAVEPEQLLPEHLEGKLAKDYLVLLIAHQMLYDEHLGRMRFDDYKIPISPDVKLDHDKPHLVARSHEENSKAKFQQLINADVLEQIYDSVMISPAFFLVKSDESLRPLVDFRWLSKFLWRSPYYLLQIREILMRLVKAKCISTYDTNLGYYARGLARIHPFTAFGLSWRKFQYKRLTMGVSTAPD